MQKYSKAPNEKDNLLSYLGHGAMTSGINKAKMKDITSITLKELDWLNEKNLDDELKDFNDENTILR